jgi:aspartokinase/homoserine dehydrogenase 1
MNVFKFGGSSLSSARMIKKVADIILSESEPLVVVVSAIGDSTDLLTETIHKSVEGHDDYIQPYKKMKEHHLAVVRALFPSTAQPEVIGQMNLEFKRGEHILEGIRILNEATEKSVDRILSIGEQISSYILSEYIKSRGTDVT